MVQGELVVWLLHPEVLVDSNSNISKEEGVNRAVEEGEDKVIK